MSRPQVATYAYPQPLAWETQILKQLDKSFQEASFPNLSTDEHGAYARSRLTAFRSEKEWLIVIEVLAYVCEAGKFLDMVYAYGNKVKKLGFQVEPRPSYSWLFRRLLQKIREPQLSLPREIFVPAPGQAFTEDNEWLPNPFDFAILLPGGEVRHFTPTRDLYQQFGIDLDKPLSRNIILDRYIQILRLLSYLIPEELFLSDDLLLKSLRRPLALSKLLQVYEWHCPDPRAKELPSSTICFRSLARSLAHNQPELYECPSHLINTHWSYWPNYFLTSASEVPSTRDTT